MEVAFIVDNKLKRGEGSLWHVYFSNSPPDYRMRLVPPLLDGNRFEKRGLSRALRCVEASKAARRQHGGERDVEKRGTEAGSEV